MANKHILSLDIPDTLNLNVLRVVDTSTYSTELAVACPTLQILVPGFTEPVTVTMVQGGETLVTACALGIQTTNCDTVLTALPDGIYVVRYSVAPNDKVFVEYNYLRITAAVNKYYNIFCNVNLSGCEPLPPEREKLTKLRLLRTMLDGAKSKVEFCHNNDQGMAIYNYVLAQLDKLSCSYCN
jgi:hypothetical protein